MPIPFYPDKQPRNGGPSVYPAITGVSMAADIRRDFETVEIECDMMACAGVRDRYAGLDAPFWIPRGGAMTMGLMGGAEFTAVVREGD